MRAAERAGRRLPTARAPFASIFAAVLNDLPVKLIDAESATHQVISGVTQNGLTAWLDDVRRYHEGTFQHCLLVTGVAVGFAVQLGFSASRRETARHGSDAARHRQGSHPARHSRQARKTRRRGACAMQSHPVIGYEALKNDGRRRSRDARCYPPPSRVSGRNRLPGRPERRPDPDIVRLLTISDIFAALIEAGPYRPPMPRPEAYNIVCGMDGKLEPALVRAFQHVALTA